MKRILLFLYHLYLVSDFFAHAKFILLTPDPIKRRNKMIKNINRIAKKFMRAFQIDLTIKNPERLAELSDAPYLLVSNHLSYTDIIMLGSLENLVFITSVEMGNNFFLGAITRLGGCLYTNRKKPISLPKEIQKFADTIKEGFKVVLFAEGTSTDGTSVKEFRKSLFQVAISAKCPILPVCIKYISLDGKEITSETKDFIYWYGDMTFAPHFMKLLGRKIKAEITILESISQIDGKTRAELSEEVYGQIHDCYHKS